MSIPNAYNAYYRQVLAMRDAAVKWHQANPGKAPIVSWNFPKDYHVAAPIASARRAGLVECNDAGWAVLAAMDAVEPDPRRAATVLMHRVALEAARQALQRGPIGGPK